MPLRFQDAPEGSRKQLLKAVDLLFQGEQAAQSPDTGFLPVFPHAVYVLGLNDVKIMGGIEASAKHVSWRYLIPQSNPPSAAEVSFFGNEHRFSELNYGPYAQNTLLEIQRLERSQELADQNYDVRLLRVPGLGIATLWLRGSDGREMLIPIAPTSPMLNSGKTYSGKQFLEAIQEEALLQLDSDTAPQMQEIWQPMHSLEETRQAIQELTNPELLRLKRFARWRLRSLGRKSLGRNEHDLLYEAVTSTVAGKRTWRQGIDLCRHLMGD